jgi:hypothetical protein
LFELVRKVEASGNLLPEIVFCLNAAAIDCQAPDSADGGRGGV